MAKKKTSETKTSVRCRCIDCKYVELHQWKDDPLIAKCLVNDNYPRQVARSYLLCNHYEQRKIPVPAVIQHTD